MSAICQAELNAAGTLTQTQIDALFTGSILPTGTLERNTDGSTAGRLTQTALSNVYIQLVTAGRLVSNEQYKTDMASLGNPSTDRTGMSTILNRLEQTETATMTSLKNEFCFYFVRYRAALDALFTTMVSISKSQQVTEANKSDLQTKLNSAKTINTRLNDMIQITNYIAAERAKEMKDQNSAINELNNSISTTFTRLRDHEQMLQKEGSLIDLKKRMVEYTQEKNLSATNLLSLFGFLNLVAIGLLFYISRS